LAQGFPNFAAPAAIKDAAKRAIDDDINQYAITWGAKSLRDRIAHAYEELYGMAVDPETMVTVTCGSTEAMISTLLALCEAGDEVIVLEPFYENYGPDAAIAGAVPVFVPLRPPAFAFDPDELRAAFTSRTKAIIVNTPNNPTGRVFTRAELEVIAGRSPEHDVICVIRRFGFDDDTEFAHWLIRDVGVAGVPGSSFFSRRELGRHLIRFTFCKTEELLEEASRRLLGARERARRRV